MSRVPFALHLGGGLIGLLHDTMKTLICTITIRTEVEFTSGQKMHISKTLSSKNEIHSTIAKTRDLQAMIGMLTGKMDHCNHRRKAKLISKVTAVSRGSKKF